MHISVTTRQLKGVPFRELQTVMHWLRLNKIGVCEIKMLLQTEDIIRLASRCPCCKKAWQESKTDLHLETDLPQDVR